jgi:hypothetical protein
MEWAIRLNLFERGFMEPALFLCEQWRMRQAVVYFTLERIKDLSETEITSTVMSQILGKMTPKSMQQFHNVKSFFDHAYKKVYAPAMHHCVQIHDPTTNYRVIDLLYDYVFSETFGKSIGEGKSHQELMPQKPNMDTTLSTSGLSVWQTWRTQVPQNRRGFLSLPPLDQPSPPP